MQLIDSRGKRKIYIMLGGIVILLVFVLLIVAPKASIELALKEKFFKQQYEVNFKSSIPKVLPNLNLIPVYEPSKIKQSEQQQFLYIDPIERAIKKKDLKSFLLAKIQSEINEGENVNENALTYTITVADPLKETLLVYAETRIAPSIGLAQLKRSIIGKPKMQANKILTAMPSVTGFNIYTTPSWLPFMPFLEERIIIKILNPKL